MRRDELYTMQASLPLHAKRVNAAAGEKVSVHRRDSASELACRQDGFKGRGTHGESKQVYRRHAAAVVGGRGDDRKGPLRLGRPLRLNVWDGGRSASRTKEQGSSVDGGVGGRKQIVATNGA